MSPSTAETGNRPEFMRQMATRIGRAVALIALVAGVFPLAAAVGPEATPGYVIVPVQLSMGNLSPKIIPPATKRMTVPAPAKPTGGLTPEGRRRLTEAIGQLTPKQRKSLAKAMKRLTPEQRSQLAETIGRRLVGQGTSSQATKQAR